MNKKDDGCIGIRILSPLTGTAVALEEVPDPVFSQKIIGDGEVFTCYGSGMLYRLRYLHYWEDASHIHSTLRIETPEGTSMWAVSYTHLDVYKRQWVVKPASQKDDGNSEEDSNEILDEH